MIYAKCIHKEQIVTTKEEFERRNGVEENAIYCVGQISVSQSANLCSVPLNYIFCCLKYGDKIAIVDSSNTEYYLQEQYPSKSSYSDYAVEVEKQKIIQILDITPTTVEFIFNQVKNPVLFPDNGYITNLEYVPFEVCKKYFELKGEPMPQWVKNNQMV